MPQPAPQRASQPAPQRVLKPATLSIAGHDGLSIAMARLARLILVCGLLLSTVWTASALPLTLALQAAPQNDLAAIQTALGYGERGGDRNDADEITPAHTAPAPSDTSAPLILLLPAPVSSSEPDASEADSPPPASGAVFNLKFDNYFTWSAGATPTGTAQFCFPEKKVLTRTLYLPVVMQQVAPPACDTYPYTYTLNVTPTTALTLGGFITVQLTHVAFFTSARLMIEALPPGQSLPPGAVDRSTFFTLRACSLATGEPITWFKDPPVATIAYTGSVIAGRLDADRIALVGLPANGAAWGLQPRISAPGSNPVVANINRTGDYGLAASLAVSSPAAVLLAPRMAGAISSTATYTRPVWTPFYTATRTITYTGGRIMLASTPDGRGDLFTDDAMTVTVRQPGGVITRAGWWFAPPVNGLEPISGVMSRPALDVSGLLVTGVNVITVTLYDTWGTVTRTQEYWLTTDNSLAAGGNGLQGNFDAGRHFGGNYPTAIAEHHVDLVTGNFIWDEMDLSVDAPRGTPIRLTRTYNAQDGSSGVFGRGWSSAYDMRLSEELDGVTVIVRRADGQRATFRRSGAVYVPGAGVFDSLDRAGATWVLTEFRTRLRYVFSDTGTLVNIKDPYNNALTVTYNIVGHPTGLIDPAGRPYTITTDASGHITGIVDVAGRALTYTYAGDALIGFRDLRQQPVTYTVENGRVTQIENALGVARRVSYDEFGRVTGLTDGDGYTVWMQHRPETNETLYRNAEGGVTTIRYDARGRLTSVVESGGGQATYAYDLHDQTTRLSQLIVSDPISGARWVTATYGYDSGRMISATDFNGFTTTYGYAAGFDAPITETNAAGQVSVYSYAPGTSDLTSWARRALDGTPLVTLTIQRNSAGQPITVANGSGAQVVAAYDGPRGELSALSDAAGAVRYEYNDIGQVARRTDANGDSITMRWEGDALVKSVTDARGGTVSYSYDAASRPVRVTNRRGYTTVYTYSARGDLLAVQDAEGGVTAYVYDGRQHRIAMIDPRGALPGATQAQANRYTTCYSYTERGDLVYVDPPALARTVYGRDLAGRVVTLTQPNGQTIFYDLDAQGRPVTTTQIVDTIGGAQVARSVNTYDAKGRLEQQLDPLGRLTTFTYDAADHLLQVIARAVSAPADPLSQVTTYTYNAAGQRATMIAADGGVTGFVYDAAGRLTHRTQTITGAWLTDTADVATTTTVYDAAGNVTQIIDANGHAITRAYDANRNVLTEQFADGQVISYTYDLENNRVARTELRRTQDISNPSIITYTPQATWRWFYDGMNRVISETDPYGHVTRYRYDAAGNLISVTNALSETTLYVYDAANQRVRQTNPVTVAALTHPSITFSYEGYAQAPADVLPGVWITYDAGGRRTAAQDARGQVTHFAYDGLNRQTLMTYTLAAGQVFTETRQYDAGGNLLVVTATDGMRHTRYAYDVFGRPALITSSEGVTQALGYDRMGRLVTRTNGLGQTWVTTYDRLGRVERVTDPLGHATRYGYDKAGNRVVITDANGSVTRYDYDARNRLVAVRQCLTLVASCEGAGSAAITQYGFDSLGNRVAITDANGNATWTAYDLLHRAVSETDALGHSWVYTYNALRLEQTADPRGQVAAHRYDPRGLRTHIDYADAATPDVTFGYDLNGNVTSIASAGLGAIEAVYDGLNRLTHVRDALGRWMTSTWDAVGNVTGLVYPDGAQVTYVYDEDNRLAGLIDADGRGTTFRYDDANNLVETVTPALTTTRRYDGASRLTGVWHTTASDVVMSHTLGLDSVGNRVTVTEQYSAVTNVKVYGYDGTATGRSR